MTDMTQKLLRPANPESTRVFFLARSAPLAPDYAVASYPGDGGYPAYYHRIFHTLRELGYRVTTSNQCRALYAQAHEIDLVFSLYNRMAIDNPEVFVAATCEFLHLPMIGAKPNIRALAEDKWMTKNFFRALGLPVAEGAIYNRPEDLAAPPPFPGPYFVKNRFGAASEGISENSIQDNWAGAKRAAETLFARGMAVLVERYAPGVDVTLPVIGADEPLILDLVRPVFRSRRKNHHGRPETRRPARLRALRRRRPLRRLRRRRPQTLGGGGTDRLPAARLPFR